MDQGMDKTQKTFNQSQFSEKSSQMGNDIESLKKRTVKKILLMSSMDQQIMKIFLKVLQVGSKYLNVVQNGEKGDGQTNKQIVLKYGSTILDKERYKELELLVNALAEEDTNYHTLSSDTFLKIIKYFVLSPVEKSYINKIESELMESVLVLQLYYKQSLDDQIKTVAEKIGEQQQKKLDKYKDEKQGKPHQKNNNSQTLLQEIAVHENKLEKANQKLNDIVAHNNELREKINQLRKEKNVVEKIHDKLKKELEDKKVSVEQTIQTAGKAYYDRNRAEEELKVLQEKAEKQKSDFEKECQELNQNIQHDKRFKQFIKSKQKEKEVLENLEKQIQKNQEIIKEKTASNAMIDNEYMLSAQKEQEIKDAFERIKKETGINGNKDKESKELLSVFINLYQKNTIMSQFVKELNEEVEELERKIEEKKKEIQMYSTKGATNDNQRREMKIALTNKIQQEEKKKKILKAQYEKSIETINLIKQYLENVFQAIEVEPEIIDKLKEAAITEENMVYFLGILEQKGLDAIQEYARLIAEQLKLEKGDVPGLSQQIDDLNNIIAYENANIMNYYSQASQNKQDCPGIHNNNNLIIDDVLSLQGEDEVNENDGKNPKGFLMQEDLKKSALEAIAKKQGSNSQNKQTNLQQKGKQTRSQNKFKTSVKT